MDFVSTVEIPDIVLEQDIPKEKPIKPGKESRNLSDPSPYDSKSYKRILFAKEKFPSIVDSVLKGKKLNLMKEEEFEVLYKDVRRAIANRPCSNSSIIKSGYFMGLGLAEAFAPYANMNLKGFQSGLENRKDVHEILDEISLDYENLDSPMNPETKLVFITLQSAYLLNKYNTDEQFRVMTNAAFEGS
jgi:hypothetical protein